ncbi:SlyX family protein [Trichloromonas sp.]|uniref:SlyX family protein n=1 Tax=Trichloromonas sp. TaxID=3069249 RepID=UPI002A4186FC|nr:SlyX family protein [Trichloromonas sp.]
MDELRQRLDELEIRYTHQGRMLEELNLVVAESARRVDRLERELTRYREMLGTLAPGLTESPDE